MKPNKCERSKDNRDVKKIDLTREEYIFDTTFYSEGGVPQEKKITLAICKVLPGGKEEIIAYATIDVRNHFG